MSYPQKIISRYFCIKPYSAYKSFDKIPGPTALPFIGSSWKYFPLIGDYNPRELHKAGERKLQKFGSIVKEEIRPGFYVINVFEPEDIEIVYKSEGKYPSRRSHLGLLHYRTSRPELYNTGGLLPVNGIEWWRLRSTFQKALSRMKDVRFFLPKSNEIVDEFLEKCVPNGEIIEDFLPLISRLNLELTWMMMFGKRLGCFEKCTESSNSIPSRLMEAAETTNCCVMQTDNTQEIWEKIKTPTYLRMERSLAYIEKIVLVELKKTFENLQGRNEEIKTGDCLMDQYLTSPGVDFKDVLGMAVDLVLGGVDTTSYTSSFICYHLANSTKVQGELKKETDILMKDSPTVTAGILNEATYTRAVLKETFRLNPIAIGISRNLFHDAVLSGYAIPKGTLVITQNMVACRQEKHFKNPNMFIPERWLKDSDHYCSVSPYLILPFSHGIRTCIARRLAEQNLLTFILKLSRKFKLRWIGDELNVITPLICKPDKPVKIMFENWENL